jgi:hypothetical protein
VKASTTGEAPSSWPALPERRKRSLSAPADPRALGGSGATARALCPGPARGCSTRRGSRALAGSARAPLPPGLSCEPCLPAIALGAWEARRSAHMLVPALRWMPHEHTLKGDNAATKSATRWRSDVAVMGPLGKARHARAGVKAGAEMPSCSRRAATGGACKRK